MELPAATNDTTAGPEPLSDYLRAIGQVPLLSAEEELALAQRVVAGDPEAGRALAAANLRLDEKRVRDERAETAQGRDEPELAKLFAQIEIEIHRAEIQLAMRFPQPVLHRHPDGAEKQNTQDHRDGAHHNSFRKKTVQARAR